MNNKIIRRQISFETILRLETINIKSFRSSLRFKRFLPVSPVRLIFLGIREESLILFPEMERVMADFFQGSETKHKEVALIRKHMNYFKFLFNLEQLLGKRYQ